MKNIKIKPLIYNILIIVLILYTSTSISFATVSYTLKPSSKTYNNTYMKDKTYNKYTKQYYMLKSYLERLESKGGGTLTLTKGEYVITNTLYIPSNVTIVLNDGVIISKGNKTGTNKLNPSKDLFHLVSNEKGKKNKSIGKYSGSNNIKIIGKGNAVIDLKNTKSAKAIVAGHNNFLKIEGITFKNLNKGNFIKIAASTKVTITNNNFKNSKESENKSSEAIKLSIPDKETDDFNYTWSKLDKTPNKTISISNNNFNNLDRAISSTRYTQGVFHEDVVIRNNIIDNIRTDAIKMLNWKNAIIENNTIKNINNGKGSTRAILGGGVINPTIRKNKIENVARPMQFMPQKNTKNGTSYAITYNKISSTNITNLKNNKVSKVREYFIRINKTYNQFSSNTDKVEINDTSTKKEFTLTPNSNTYRNKYMTSSNYNENTKHYYLIRSYLERLEALGGGTLSLKKGTYVIPAILYVPSNVTIYLNDGVVIKKGTVTSSTSLTPKKSIFQLVSPSKATIKGVHSRYNGEKNIRFIGRGTATIDLDYYYGGIGIVAGHNQNIRIENIKFKNMNSGHFLEVDATNNATIINNEFINSYPSPSLNKEAINLDTPDRETQGWNNNWSNYDRTANKNILIENNLFYNLDRAIGTHKYSQGEYHESVIIRNNTIDNMRSDAIRVMNWKSSIITNNLIKNIQDGDKKYRGILASGAINPIIKNNTFENIPRAMQFMPWKNNGPGSKYDITYNEISDENKNYFLNNQINNVSETFIRINYVFDVFDDYTERLFFY